jgi:tetratricopeptide (TPR) repeat protein
MVAFIAFVVVAATGYFTYRAMPEYFEDLYVQAKQYISGEEARPQQTKKVSVNSALDQMMPTRSDSPAEETASQNEEPEQLDVARVESSTTYINEPAQEELTANGPDLSEGETEIPGSDDEAFEPPEFVVETVSAPIIPGQNDDGPVPVPVPVEQQSFIQFSDSDEMNAEIAELNGEATEAVNEGEVSLAVRLYRQILNIEPGNHDARKKLAVLHYSNNETGAASVVLTEGIEIDPERVDYRLMLARLFYREKKLKQAYAVLAQIEPDVQRNIDFFGLKATVAQELELNAESSHLYGRLVIFEPNRAQWWLGLAISLDRLRQREGALRAYENAADLRQLSASADDFIRQRILELGG